jgi:hypothetical protein
MPIPLGTDRDAVAECCGRWSAASDSHAPSTLLASQDGLVAERAMVARRSPSGTVARLAHMLQAAEVLSTGGRGRLRLDPRSAGLCPRALAIRPEPHDRQPMPTEHREGAAPPRLPTSARRPLRRPVARLVGAWNAPGSRSVGSAASPAPHGSGRSRRGHHQSSQQGAREGSVGARAGSLA